MTPDDPRHGHRAGYIAGCRDDCCSTPHYRYQKFSSLRRIREGSQYVDPQPVLDRVAHWGTYGVSLNALSVAAGLSDSTIRHLVATGCRPERATARAILAVTWDHLPGSALVNAELARQRLFSLMAAGHTLAWIGDHVDTFIIGGKWRDQDRIKLDLACKVRDCYRTAPLRGTSAQTAAKAATRGYLVPMAWDDPDTPAMPHGWRPTVDGRPAKRLTVATEPRRRTDVDPVVVQRILAGEPLPATVAERNAVVAAWAAAGRSLGELERMTGWRAERYRGGAA